MSKIHSSLTYHGYENSDLGRVAWAGISRTPAPYFQPSMQILGIHALVYIVRGRGRYQNALRHRQDFGPGDLIALFPEMGHQYGPTTEDGHDELFLAVKGPLAELWQRIGWLNPIAPILHLEPVDFWRAKFLNVTAYQPSTATEALRPLSLLHDFLSEAHIAASISQEASSEAAWLNRARRLLAENLSEQVSGEEVARTIGVSYDTFRYRFRQQTGASPARYRMEQRVTAASDLLLHTSLSLRQIAARLGFCSEFHFSQKFKQLKGVSPRDFRRRTHCCPN